MSKIRTQKTCLLAANRAIRLFSVEQVYHNIAQDIFSGSRINSLAAINTTIG